MLSMWILMFSLLHCTYVTALTFKRDDHPEYRLFEKLFNENVSEYHPNVRPTIDYHKPITVNVSVNLVTLHSLIERSQTLRTTVWIDLEWTDMHMAWNHSHFAHIDSIVVPEEKLWVPDVCIANEVTNNKCLIKSEKGKSLLEYTGKVTLWWNREVQTRCDVDISRYPFDSQMCSIRIGTWYSEDEKVKLTPKFNNIDFSNYVLSEEWDIVDSNIKTDLIVNDKNFTELEFFIVMDRKPLFYLYSTVLPILLLSVLNMVCFLVPIGSGEKIGMTMAIFLTFAVFMTLISSTVPRSSEHVFKFGIFMTMHLVMSGITILLEVFVSFIYYKPKGTKMNRVYTWILNRSISNDKNDNETRSSLQSNDSETMMCFGCETDSWQKLALELDKVFGYIVTIINALLIVLFFVTVNIE
ncbi:neuronal acetylcholine receptor subunit alpha-3-like [Saccostrea echinata]|uniref:neuronal acetylcholine receptor subunit alpha-3-like n=1 Tax=Saccostrea echinata TaxID=191078 RepID=UPI002A840B06|nr:neuronal acetylcholine receptor subunit alpha-3-like [Saccostrea echinata]